MSNKKDNSLDKENQLKAIEWLEKKWKNDKKCEVCGESKWTIQEHIVTPIVLQNNSIQLGGVSYPQIMSICNNCTNTKYFNFAMINRIMEKKDGDKDGK